MYGNDRTELREIFFRAWRKHRMNQPLEGIEKTIVEAALRHPEYHRVLDAPDAHEDRDYLPALGESNPFMHLSLHIAIEEQLSIDQPPGARDCFLRLMKQLPDPHDAQHKMMECLAETVWHAQQHGHALDESDYGACLQKLGRSA